MHTLTIGGNTSAIVTATEARTCMCICVFVVYTYVRCQFLGEFHRTSAITSRMLANRDKIYVPEEKRGSDSSTELFYLFLFVLGDVNVRYSLSPNGSMTQNDDRSHPRRQEQRTLTTSLGYLNNIDTYGKTGTFNRILKL